MGWQHLVLVGCPIGVERVPEAWDLNRWQIVGLDLVDKWRSWLIRCCGYGEKNAIPDSTVHGANMGPIWGRQDPGGPHVGPMNFAILDAFMSSIKSFSAEYQLNHWSIEDVEVILQV